RHGFGLDFAGKCSGAKFGSKRDFFCMGNDQKNPPPAQIDQVQFDFTKSFEYSDEWPTNPGISDTPEMHRAKGFLMPLQRCPFLAAIARRKGEWQGYTNAEVRVCHIID